MVEVVVVEDVPALRDDLCIHLQAAGFEATGLDDGPALRGHLARRVPDIAVLDIGLPGESGLQLAELLRRQHPQVGIVLLTGRSLLQDRLAGRGAGADEYLSKPVQMEEMVLVLRNLARRLRPADGAGWLLDVAALRLQAPRGGDVGLTAAEMHVMKALAAHPDRQASRQRIVEAMGLQWQTYDERLLEAIVSRLRGKLAAQFGLAETPLRSLRGEGYAFVEPLGLR